MEKPYFLNESDAWFFQIFMIRVMTLILCVLQKNITIFILKG